MFDVRGIVEHRYESSIEGALSVIEAPISLREPSEDDYRTVGRQLCKRQSPFANRQRTVFEPTADGPVSIE